MIETLTGPIRIVVDVKGLIVKADKQGTKLDISHREYLAWVEVTSYKS